MDSKLGQRCTQPDLVAALARGELSGQQRRRAERLLEQSGPCRELFRQLTVGRFPDIPSYTILEQVGKGGFGVVYKAIHHAKQRTEALKVLFGRTPLLTSYFENEVRLISHLQHPNIATLYEAQLTTVPPYYTMEFVEGERLNEYLRAHNVSLARRIEIIRTVALAIGYAHDRGVVHRDIKPQNILIDDHGQPHVVDFGIAKRLAWEEGLPDSEEGERSQAHGGEAPVGTLGFIAPEQVRGDTVDGRADIFALGALLFQCVTGEPARLARDAGRCLQLLRERGVGHADDLAAIIARCVEEQRERRYPSCTELAADLERYLSGRPIAARREPSPARQAARIAALVVRNHPHALRFTLVTLVALLTAGLFLRLGARRFAVGSDAVQTVVVGFDGETLDAIAGGRLGADLPEPRLPVGSLRSFPKTWRILHGQLMERLAPARPKVVVWDCYFPDNAPRHCDEAFARGAARLGAPVVVGVEDFDVNAEPVMSPVIRAAVFGYGTLLAADPATFANEFEVVGAMQRGREPPIPSLAVVGFAATRFPESIPNFIVDGEYLRIMYRKRHVESGRFRWEQPEDRIPLVSVSRITQSELRLAPRGAVNEGDILLGLRVRREPAEYWNNRVVSYARVFEASESQLRDWFTNKAVVIGTMIPGIDQHRTHGGDRIFGCQVHALALEALLSRQFISTLGWRELVWRTLAWALLGAVLVSPVAVPTRLRLGWIWAGSLLGLAGGLILGVEVAARWTDPWRFEAGLAAATLLLTASPGYVLKAIRQRQLQLAPQAITFSTDAGELPSTILAQTR